MKKLALFSLTALLSGSNAFAAGGGGHVSAGAASAGMHAEEGIREEAVAATSAQATPAAPGVENVNQGDATASASTTATTGKSGAKMKDAAKNPPAPKTVYLTIGGGADIPTANSSIQTRSANGTFSPTPAGTGIFNLPSVNWNNKFATGYDAYAAIGSLFTTNTRLEAEFLFQNIKRKVTGTYSFNEIAVLSGNTFASSINNSINQTTNRAKLYSFLGNLYYDFHNKTKWTPFLGAGLGAAWIHSPKTTWTGTMNIVDTTASTTTAVPVVANSPMLSGAAFAYQLKAGVSYDVTQRASFALQYRFFGTSEFAAHSNSVTINSATFTVGQQNTARMRNNTVDLSFRYLVW